MDEDREHLMKRVISVRTKVREIIELCKTEELWPVADLVTEKCDEIIDLTTPIIFEGEQ
jgi:hypothetical protein